MADADNRAAFAGAAADLLGHYYVGTDREVALAAIAVAVARSPLDSPMDDALRAFVVAIAPIAGRSRLSPADAAQMSASKRAALADALSAGPAIVVLDASAPGVDVPERFKAQRDLKLRVGYDLRPRIDDIELGDAELSCTLLFQGEPHWCRVPWEAVWAVGGEATSVGRAWPLSAPPGMISREEPPAGDAPNPPPANPPAAKARLSLVPESCDGIYVDEQGAQRSCRDSEGCGLAGCVKKSNDKEIT